MCKFKAGQNVRLKIDCLKKYPELKKYDIIYFSITAKVIHVSNDPKGIFPETCMIEFKKGSDCHIIDVESELLEEFEPYTTDMFDV